MQEVTTGMREKGNGMGPQRTMEKKKKIKTLVTERCANIKTLYIYISPGPGF